MPTDEQREAHYQQFLAWFEQATALIPIQYMLLPVAYQSDPIYRERVYCYELYHQLRVAIDLNFPYLLGGEVDKTGHQIMCSLGLDKIKPDLVVHQPGDMGGNLVVMEVKPVIAMTADIQKDLRNLTRFVSLAGYHRAIYLVYSGTCQEFDSFRERAVRLAQDVEENQIDLRVIDLYWHWGPSLTARMENWRAG